MKFLFTLSIFLLTSCLLFAQNYNQEVLKAARKYKDGGGYYWRSTGSPVPINFKNNLIINRSAKGTYCSGFTFAVAFDVLNNNKLLDHLTIEQVKQLRREWYGATPESAEKQCLFTITKNKLGEIIPFGQALPGDFIQFWRSKSGHSAVFLNWIMRKGEIVGFSYRSSQKSTNGIAYNKEYFSEYKEEFENAAVDRKRFYTVRIGKWIDD